MLNVSFSWPVVFVRAGSWTADDDTMKAMEVLAG
jgi:hypothetical protein